MKLDPLMLLAVLGVNLATPWGGHAAPLADGQPDQGKLLGVAAEKREAIITLHTPTGSSAAVMSTFGFFVSADGAALCDLRSFVTGGAPKDVRTLGGAALKPARIIASYPDQDLALVRFDFQPKAWLEISSEPAAMGSRVALLDPDTEQPAAVGPVLARYLVINSGHRVVEFSPLYSIGSGLRYGARAMSGDPVVDESGHLVGVHAGARPRPSQTFVMFHPVEKLAAIVAEALATDTPSDSIEPGQLENPYDLAIFSMTYGNVIRAFSQRDLKLASRHILSLKQQFPESQLGNMLEFDLAGQSGDTERLKEILASPAFALEKGPRAADAAVYYTRLAQGHMAAGELDKAIEACEASVKVTPADFPYDRAMLANLYRTAGRLVEAETFYRQAIAISPEDIKLLEQFQKTLDDLDKGEEASELFHQIARLERLYQRP